MRNGNNVIIFQPKIEESIENCEENKDKYLKVKLKSILKKVLFTSLFAIPVAVITLIYTNALTITMLCLSAVSSIIVYELIDEIRIRNLNLSQVSPRELSSNPEMYYTEIARNITKELKSNVESKVEYDKIDSKSIEEKPKTPTKNEVIGKINYELEEYRKIYNFSSLDIECFEWDSLFDNLYCLFIKKNLEHRFYDLIIQYLKMCLAGILINKRKFNIYSFISELDILKSNIFTSDDINRAKEQILNEINNRKLIYIKNYI